MGQHLPTLLEGPILVVPAGIRPNCEVAVFIDGPLALTGKCGPCGALPGLSERATGHISSSVSRWNPFLLLCQRGGPDSREC